MIVYIKGKITHSTPTEVHIELSNGLAYEVHISLNTFALLESKTDVKLYTQLIVRDDAHLLYGFFTIQEKQLFQKLVSVSGIGPNTARVILSSMQPEDVIRCIANDDHVSFSKVKGIGPKTAKRIILDLKDKISTEIGEDFPLKGIKGNTNRDEALSALLTLGFPKVKVEKVLQAKISGTDHDHTTEELIKLVLKELS